MSRRTQTSYVWIKYSIRLGNRTEPKSGWGLYRREMDESSFSLEWLIQGWEESSLRPGSEESKVSYDWRWQQHLWPTETSLQLWVIIVMTQTCSQLTVLHASSQATSYTHGSQLTMLHASSQATSLSPASKSLVLAAWRMKKYIAFLGRKLILKVIKDD